MVERLYRTYEKEGMQSPITESICEDCANDINNDKDSNVTADLDVHATKCWEEDEETCAICERSIDRTEQLNE